MSQIDPQPALTAASTCDASGLKCPLPVLKARKAIKLLAVGELLELIATDPSARQDVPAFCAVSGDHLRAVEQRGSAWHYWIEKA